MWLDHPPGSPPRWPDGGLPPGLYLALLNARLRRYRAYDVQFSTGNSALPVDSDIERSDLNRLTQSSKHQFHDRWVTETAKRPLERINRFDDETNEYARMARDQYGDNIEQHRQAVLSAVESLDTAPDAASVGASTASADTTSESSADIEAESNTSVADASPADDHDPTEQDASADSDDGLGNFDAGEFDPET